MAPNKQQLEFASLLMPSCVAFAHVIRTAKLISAGVGERVWRCGGLTHPVHTVLCSLPRLSLHEDPI